MRTIPFFAKFGEFTTIIRFNKDGQCFQPPGVTMPDGEYQLLTAHRRVLGSFTVTNGQASRDIHDEVSEDLIQIVRTQVVLAESIGSPGDEYMTTYERMDQTLARLEAAIDMIEHRPIRHAEVRREMIARNLTRADMLHFVVAGISKCLQRGVEQILLGHIVDATPESLAELGLETTAPLEPQIARLRVILAWQPAEPATSSPES